MPNLSSTPSESLSPYDRAILRECLRRGLTAPSDSESWTPYRNDPVGFAREVLAVEPWQAQIDIMEALAREDRVTVRSCNGAGKTICAAWCVLWFLYTRPGAIVITTAPTGYQVVNLLWRRIREAHAAAKVTLPGRCMTKQIECGANWYALGMATDEEIHFQGPHSSAGVLMVGDEASGLKPWMFQAMAGSLTEPGAKLLLIGNPNDASGAFYESHKSWEPGQRFHISAFDVPAHVLRPTWKEEIERDYGRESPIYQVRVLGEFPDEGEGQLFPLSLVEAARVRDLEPEARADTVVGVDVAYEGSDESVAYVRRGGKVLAAAYWRGFNTLLSAGRVTPLAKEWGAARVNVDVIGYGAGCKDQLTDNFRGSATAVSGINVAGAPQDKERFYNLRSELFWGLRQRFVDGDISIPAEDGLLVEQLVTLKFTYTPRGQIKVVGKDEMRKDRPANAKWHSCDRADALMLAFAQGGNRWVPRSAASVRPVGGIENRLA
jgi:phage terminase large subunit